MPGRLDGLVAQAAGISRKQATSLIKDGRVRINGEPALLPARKIGDAELITLDGAKLHTGTRYFMLNKPAGVVCATRDTRFPTVLDLLPQPLRRGLFPAGRLDRDTEGFVLLTDDGRLAHRLLSPRTRAPKTYHVVLDRPFNLSELQARFSEPLDLGGGDITSPALLRLLPKEDPFTAELVIYEGMYHQVKRMFGAFSLKVTGLRRVSIGGVALDPALGPGEFRPLLEAEICSLLEW